MFVENGCCAFAKPFPALDLPFHGMPLIVDNTNIK
jgi:hypothetical protein